jgi:hypothetical protein
MRGAGALIIMAGDALLAAARFSHMRGDTMPIFRADAARRYMESQEKTVLPRLVSPPVFICLWILLGLLVIGAAVSLFAQAPVYISCPAVIVDWRNRYPSVDGATAVVAFLPLENISRVKSGQKLFVQFDAAGGRFSQPVSFVDPQIISPDAAHRQFTLNGAAATAINRPSAVAIARLERIPDGPPAAAYVGGVYNVDIEVGSRRLITLLPLVGRLFSEDRL